MKKLTLVLSLFILMACGKNIDANQEYETPSWAIEVDSVIANYNTRSKIVKTVSDTLPNGLEVIELYSKESDIEKIYVKALFEGYHFETVLYEKKGEPYFSELIGMQPILAQKNHNVESGVATLFKERYYFNEQEMQLKLKKSLELMQLEDYEKGRRNLDTILYKYDSVDDSRRSFYQVGQMYKEIKTRIK